MASQQKPKKKLKWYEKEEEEIPEPPKITIKSPSKLRNEIHELKIKKKSVSNSTVTANSHISIKVLIFTHFDVFYIHLKKNGSVITAEHKIELAREMPIWDADFIESEGMFFSICSLFDAAFSDPDELKRLAIAKREAAFSAAKKEEEEKIAKNKSVTPTSEVNYEDIDLNAVEQFEELEKLEMNHLKYLLQIRKLKCGGNAMERAKRLFSVRGLAPSQYPKKIQAKH